MQSLEYATSGEQTINVWPEITASLVGNPSASYELHYVQDYDQSSGSLNLTLLNTPSRVDPRLQFRLPKNALPQYTGNYTIEIKEGLGTGRIWSDTATQWSSADFRWSDTTPQDNLTTIDTDRAWISGSDVPSFTQYVSPDEIGAYSTYNG